MSLEYHLLFIFVSILNYKERLKLEKEGLKQPYHNLMLKTGLGKLCQIIWESEQLFAFGVKKISALWNSWNSCGISLNNQVMKDISFQLTLLGKLCGPEIPKNLHCFSQWPDWQQF